MGYGTVIKNMIEQELLDMHTAYLGKVLSISGNNATVQPLGMYKQYGEKAKSQAVVNALIVGSAKYKITGISDNIPTVKAISVGDIVICVCCDRDITEAKKGKNTELPVNIVHSLSSSVIVGIL